VCIVVQGCALGGDLLASNTADTTCRSNNQRAEGQTAIVSNTVGVCAVAQKDGTPKNDEKEFKSTVFTLQPSLDAPTKAWVMVYKADSSGSCQVRP
jgi:hypothetical protein